MHHDFERGMNAPGALTGAFACDRPRSTALQRPPSQVCRLRNSGIRRSRPMCGGTKAFPERGNRGPQQGPLAHGDLLGGDLQDRCAKAGCALRGPGPAASKSSGAVTWSRLRRQSRVFRSQSDVSESRLNGKASSGLASAYHRGLVKQTARTSRLGKRL